MNKQFFSMFLAAVIVATTALAFSSCADPDLVGTGAAQTTEVTQTDAPVSGDTIETETNSVSESVGESQSETQTEASGEVGSTTEPYVNNHHHGTLYDYDDETMLISGVFRGNLVERLIMDVQTWSGDGIRIFKGDKEVFEGELEEGMKVQIYHDDILYGEYKVGELKIPSKSYETMSENTGS